MSATGPHKPYGMDRCPWQFRKIGDTWCRRPVNTNDQWSALHVKRIGTPPDNHRRRSDLKQLPSIYEWTWK